MPASSARHSLGILLPWDLLWLHHSLPHSISASSNFENPSSSRFSSNMWIFRFHYVKGPCRGLQVLVSYLNEDSGSSFERKPILISCWKPKAIAGKKQPHSLSMFSAVSLTCTTAVRSMSNISTVGRLWCSGSRSVEKRLGVSDSRERPRRARSTLARTRVRW